MADRYKRILAFSCLAALFCWSIFAYVELGRYFREQTLFARTINGRPYVSDFAHVYMASILAGRATRQEVDLYDINVQNQELEKLIAPVKPEQPFFLQNPPSFFLLVLPLSFLSMPMAWLLWVSLAAVLIVWSMYLLAGDGNPKKRAIISVMPLATFAGWQSIELGQTALYLFVAVAFLLLMLLGRRHLKAGLSNIFLMVKVQYFFPLALMGTFIGNGGYVLGTSLVALALVSLSGYLFGWHNVTAFPHALLFGETSKQVSGVQAIDMQNFRGQLVLLFNQDSSAINLSAIAIFAVSILLLACAWSVLFRRRSDDETARFKLFASFTILVMLIASPHTHAHDYIVAAIPCLWLWQRVEAAADGSSRQALIQFLALSFFPLTWVAFYFQPIFMICHIQPLFFWNVALCLSIWPELISHSASS